MILQMMHSCLLSLMWSYASSGLPHLVLLIGIWTNASWHVVFGLPSYVHVSLRRHYWHVKERNHLKLKCMRPFPSREKTHSQRGVGVATSLQTCACFKPIRLEHVQTFWWGLDVTKSYPVGVFQCIAKSFPGKSGRWYEMLDLSRKLGNSLQFGDFYGFFRIRCKFLRQSSHPMLDQ